jgi:hypothetical protein
MDNAGAKLWRNAKLMSFLVLGNAPNGKFAFVMRGKPCATVFAEQLITNHDKNMRPEAAGIFGVTIFGDAFRQYGKSPWDL